jgi:AcrR family transcriptional regulator
MMAYRRTPRIQARIDAAHDRIVDAAVDRLATGGWSSVSVAAVAADAGVATGTLYRHFDAKTALLAAAFRKAAGRELEIVTAAAGAEGPPDQRLDAALRVFAERALRGRRLAYALLAEPAGEAVEAQRRIYRAGYRAVFREVLGDGIADGSIVDHDTEVVAAALVGAMGEVLVGPVAPVEVMRIGDPRVDELVATCLRAVPFGGRA